MLKVDKTSKTVVKFKYILQQCIPASSTYFFSEAVTNSTLLHLFYTYSTFF